MDAATRLAAERTRLAHERTLMAWIQHRQAMKTLRNEFGPTPYSIAAVTSGFAVGLGVVAQVGVALRV